MTSCLGSLPWLPRAAADFRGQCKTLLPETPGLGDRLRQLASHYLDDRSAEALARTVKRLREAEADFRPLKPVRLGLLSNANMDLAIGSLVAAGLRHGLLIEVIATDFGQYFTEAVDPRSALNSARPDVVLLALDHRVLFPTGFVADRSAAEAAVTDALKVIDDIRAALGRHHAATVLVQTVTTPPAGLFGSLDGRLPGSLRRMIADFNQRLLDGQGGSGEVVLDVAHMAAAAGLAAWCDPKHWNFGKIPFSPDFIPLYCDHVGRLLAALYGKSRKCLVLDLDNTVWGGVIGDDGLDGIVIGQGNPVGEAHLEVQQTALALHGRGIVLAVSSKNDDPVARRPFREHPEMLLKESHISVFQANWEDKARNLRAIAETLNIGLDALVFLDDNPAEREMIRRELPMVAVPELPDDPALFAGRLLQAGYFEAVQFTDDDRARNQSYADNARRAQLMAEASDVEGYLAALDMTLEVDRFTSLSRARVAQLVNKTNQWNLTTRRYTEAEIAAFEQSGQALTLYARLKDRFGDNGIIAVTIVLANGKEWRIDTWLMSCRVLNRKVEHAICNCIAAAAKAAGAEALIGEFIPSGRNDMVREHYARMGFVPTAGGDDGGTRWRLELSGFAPFDVPMTINTHLYKRTGR